MRCPCCGCVRLDNIGKIPDAIMFSGRELSSPLPGGILLKCLQCNLRFRYPSLDKKTLDDLYRNGSSDNWKWTPASRVDWQIAKRWLSTYHSQNRSILDLGCYDGTFLASLPECWDRYGIEAHPDAAAKASQHGINMVGFDFSDIKKLASVDAIVAFDVIEHVHDPLEFVQMCMNHLKESGLMIISTGNSASVSWHLLGSKHSYVACAEHISFLNPQWVKWAAPMSKSKVWQIESYRRRASGIIQRLIDIDKNLLYRCLPGIVRCLRSNGIARLQHPALLDHPPTWPSAKDHMIFALIKSA